MSTLTQASHQWATRPSDERFTSLISLADHFTNVRNRSREIVVPNKHLTIVPNQEDHKGLTVVGPNGGGYAPTHWSFNQLSGLGAAPAGYLRTLPAELVADNLNYKLHVTRDIDDVGVLLEKPSGDSPVGSLRAATGPRYGRVWNEQIARALVDKFGDGVNGDWRVPGEFGKAVTVDKSNTTLYAGDRDMFVFLADEQHRIEVPNRRNGQAGQMARGFFVWNSEVGSTSFGLGTFLFDYVCCNRIVWGAEGYQEIRIRHTASAPERFLSEIQPALITYANSSSKGIDEAIKVAREKKLGDDLDTFLAGRFGASKVASLKAIHELEEGRPIETVWDVTVAATAAARSITWQDERVALERQAGALLKVAA